MYGQYSRTKFPDSFPCIGEAAICPSSSNIVAVFRSNVSLQVSIDGCIPISASEVMWTGPAVTESGVLMDGNKRLFIQNVEAHDSGPYNNQFRAVMTTINLDVQGMFKIIVLARCTRLYLPPPSSGPRCCC